jgi:hypothetical protein
MEEFDILYQMAFKQGFTLEYIDTPTGAYYELFSPSWRLKVYGLDKLRRLVHSGVLANLAALAEWYERS